MHLFLQVMHVQIWKSEVGTNLSNVLTVHVLTGVSVCKIIFPIFGKYNSIKILTSYSPSNIPTKTNKNPLKSHPSTFHGGMRICDKIRSMCGVWDASCITWSMDLLLSLQRRTEILKSEKRVVWVVFERWLLKGGVKVIWRLSVSMWIKKEKRCKAG